MILRYVNPVAAGVADRILPAGTETAAWYTQDEGFVLWKMDDPAGRLIGHLFHLVRDLTVHDDRVSYTDLLLDIWVDPEGGMQVLDEDELDTEVQEGRVGEEDRARARVLERDVTSRAVELVEELDRVLQQRG